MNKEQTTPEYHAYRHVPSILAKMAGASTKKHSSWWVLKDNKELDKTRLAEAVRNLDHLDPDDFDNLYTVVEKLVYIEAYVSLIPDMKDEVVMALERARRLYKEQKAIREEAKLLVETIIDKVSER